MQVHKEIGSKSHRSLQAGSGLQHNWNTKVSVTLHARHITDNVKVYKTLRQSVRERRFSATTAHNPLRTDKVRGQVP